MKKKTPYTLELHSHRFACWTAGRGASVKGCRFSVEQAKEFLEAAGFNRNFKLPSGEPTLRRVDAQHTSWRDRLIKVAKPLTGKPAVAAKLIAIYLKTRYVVGGDHRHPWVAHLHPPIDNLLLAKLGKIDYSKHGKEWKRFHRKGWSNLDTMDHGNAIKWIRDELKGKPLWAIEEYWPGHK